MIKKVTTHAGHNKQGKIACGASDYLDESKECRYINKLLIKELKKHGIKVKNATVNNGLSQTDVLAKICAICNLTKNVDLNISLHMNACSHEKKKDGKTKGVEVWIHENGSSKDLTRAVAEGICSNIATLGFTNRGVKTTKNLYFLNRTNKPSLLVEICFVDDVDDATLYMKNKKKIAKAIAEAILNCK